VFFSYNFVHDLESVVWMAIDFVLSRASRSLFDHTPWKDLQPAMEAVRDLKSAVIVDNVRGSQARTLLMTDPVESENLQKALRAIYGTQSPVPSVMKRLITTIRDAHRAVECSRLLKRRDFLTPNFADRARFSSSTFSDKVYLDLREAFMELSRHFQTTNEALLCFKDIDLDTGKLLRATVAPSTHVGQASASTPTPIGTASGTKRKADDPPMAVAPPPLKRSRSH
ncbi:hypothetical protein EV121DRAFT_274877, partial [Schizophyllum commune]